MHDQPQKEYIMKHKADNFSGKDSSSFYLKSLKTQNHYQTLFTKIVYFLEILYFKNMNKNKALDAYSKGKYELRITH